MSRRPNNPRAKGPYQKNPGQKEKLSVLGAAGSLTLREKVKAEGEYMDNPDNGLDIPLSILERFEEDGYILRWIRFSLNGSYDNKNLFNRFNQGYTLVSADEVPELQAFTTLCNIKDKGEGLSVGDLVLAKIPAEKVYRRLVAQEQRAHEFEEAVNYDVKKNQLIDKSSSRVSVGRGARFAD